MGDRVSVWAGATSLIATILLGLLALISISALAHSAIIDQSSTAEVELDNVISLCLGALIAKASNGHNEKPVNPPGP